jgi:predicted RecA/RadA family phage recombinase
MINQLFTGTPSSRRQVALPVNIVAGQAILVGNEPAVALDNYQANIGGATCLFNGTFSLAVTAKSSLSPSTGKQVKPGDPIYADGGTLDTATNVTWGFTLDANSSGVLFGHCDPTGLGLVSATTGVIGVTAGGI